MQAFTTFASYQLSRYLLVMLLLHFNGWNGCIVCHFAIWLSYQQGIRRILVISSIYIDFSLCMHIVRYHRPWKWVIFSKYQAQLLRDFSHHDWSMNSTKLWIQTCFVIFTNENVSFWIIMFMCYVPPGMNHIHCMFYFKMK